jgi:hypothetical protein
MFELKSIHREAIPAALEKVERYRLLNEPRVAESICHDILAVDAENQQALVMLVLALSDQFDQEANLGMGPVLELIPRLKDEYQRCYYAGIVYERQGKARLKRNYPGARFDAYELLRQAMEWFEKAEKLQPPGHDDAILRWNTCVRLMANHRLEPRPREEAPTMLE